MELIQFLPEELLILVVAIYTLGSILKKIDFVADKYIVIILLIFGQCATLANEFSFNSIILGVIATGIAVLGNQTIKQLYKEE